VRAYLDLVALKEVNKSLNADGSPTGYLERNGVKGSMGFMPQSAIADNGTLPRDELRYNVGRYQMKQVDVDDMRARYDKKIDDFSPESQDRIAVAKMKYRGVMEPLETGDIRSAIKKGGQEWASLPGSPYGQVQSGYTADQAVEYYNKRLAFHQAQDRGQNAPTQGESKPSPSQGTGALADGVLKQGEKGEDVRKLQEALNKNGAKLEADGNFGPATKAAVESYQRSHSLGADGIAGAKTLAALGMTAPQQAAQTDKPQTAAPAVTDKPQAPAPAATDRAQAPPAAGSNHGHSHDHPSTPSANAQPVQPSPTDKPQITNSNHPDNKLYQQALSNLEQLGPSGGFKSREDLEKAAAAVAVDAKLTKPPLTEITHISKTTAPNGQTFLVATQGDPTNPGVNRSYIDYNQATTQTVAQSTNMAEAQKPVAQQAQATAAQQTDPQPEPVRLAASGR
jgi:Putative peptidoglycan binding domain